MIEEMKIYSALKGKIEGPNSFKSNRSNYRLGSIGLEGNEYETQLVGLLRETQNRSELGMTDLTKLIRHEKRSSLPHHVLRNVSSTHMSGSKASIANQKSKVYQES